MIDIDLLFRYQGNECTPQERERFERWLAADPRHRRFMNALVVAAGLSLDKINLLMLTPPGTKAP
ncbi:MAG: FecR/PupR family sigma factor regulator [Gemmatimonadaceae bacterium]